MEKPVKISFKVAKTKQDFIDGVSLFKLYADTLDLDLSFQEFANELKTINKQYNKPKGALLLVYGEGHLAGCVGIRKLDNATAELKRMFVLPAFRGYKIGEKMLDRIIPIAKDLHYKTIRLDTLQTMIRALNLYRSYGFYEIDAYRLNPLEGPVFMEKKLN
jgi:putative acetyltransferase